MTGSGDKKKRKVLCIANPLSGGGLPLRRWPQVVSLLESFDTGHELLAEEGVAIDRLVLDRLNRGDCGEFAAIAGIGGDGTQSAIINALMRYSREHPDVTLPPYGFIPMGSGNDIAKSFGLSSRADFFVDDLRRSVSTLIHGADYLLDLGLMNGTYFADAITIGLDSHTLQLRNRQKRILERIPVLRRLTTGGLLYTWASSFGFFRHGTVQAEVMVDGQLWYSGPILNLIINNTRIYAGEFDFCTECYGNDGLLDVVVFSGRGDYLRKYLLSFRHNPRDIRRMATRLSNISSHCQGRHIRVSLSVPEAAQFDGEELPEAESFDVKVVPGAIRIKTPAEP